VHYGIHYTQGGILVQIIGSIIVFHQGGVTPIEEGVESLRIVQYSVKCREEVVKVLTCGCSCDYGVYGSDTPCSMMRFPALCKSDAPKHDQPPVVNACYISPSYSHPQGDKAATDTRFRPALPYTNNYSVLSLLSWEQGVLGGSQRYTWWWCSHKRMGRSWMPSY